MQAFAALARDDLPAFAAALSAGAQPMDYAASGLTLMHQAARDARAAFLEKLRASGPGLDLEASLPDGRRALHLAVQGNNTATVMWLLEAGANATVSCRGWGTPLHLAARLGSTVLLRALVSHGAHWDVGDASGKTPLQVLARHHPDKVRMWKSSMSPHP